MAVSLGRPPVVRVLEKVGAAALLVTERTKGRVRSAWVGLTVEEAGVLDEAVRSFPVGVRVVERGVQPVAERPVRVKVAW